METTRAVVPGSLSAVAQRHNVSIAESFVNARAVAIVDTSGSMSMEDAPQGLSRYAVAVRELAALQQRNDGQVAVIAFSDEVQFVPGGVPPYMGAGTDLTKALAFARIADVPGMVFVVISDGMPNSAEEALAEAAKFTNVIHTIYVGPEYAAIGSDFLLRLSAASGGKHACADRAVGLMAAAEQLLLIG
jgi:Mg-chelatase subunit ChlD